QAASQAPATDRMPKEIPAGLAGLLKTIDLVRSSRLDEGARYELLTRLRRKQADFQGALTLAEGLTVEPTADDGDVVPGQPFTVKTHVWNEGADHLALQEVAVRVPAGWT